jgi:hypothetical protein
VEEAMTLTGLRVDERLDDGEWVTLRLGRLS